MKKIVFEVSARDFAPVAMKEIQDLRDKINKIEAQILRDFEASDRFNAAKECAGSNLGQYDRGKAYPKIALVSSMIVVEVPVKIVDDAGTTATKPAANVYSNLPERTLNLLLGSKLISDEEKRRLISAMTGGILDLPKAAEPVEVAK